MNILLTGGAGYIGSHTALALRRAGFAPVVLDDLSRGHEWAVKHGPLVRGDMGDEVFVRKVCAEYKPEALLHFAGLIDVAESVGNPAMYMESNFRKAGKLFSTAADCGVGNIVFSSTAAVYGNPVGDSPIDEDHPLSPINPYGESKLLAERFLRGISGVKSMTLRYFNAAGAAANECLGEAHPVETHLIPRTVMAGINDESITIFGDDYPTPDGTAIRDYVHVMDLADAHVAALRYLLGGGKTGVCNLGTGNGYSVREVVTAVERALGRKIRQTVLPRRAGDPPRLVANAARALNLLSWKPRATLDDIVRSAVQWHRGRME